MIKEIHDEVVASNKDAWFCEDSLTDENLMWVEEKVDKFIKKRKYEESAEEIKKNLIYTVLNDYYGMISAEAYRNYKRLTNSWLRSWETATETELLELRM